MTRGDGSAIGRGHMAGPGAAIAGLRQVSGVLALTLASLLCLESGLFLAFIVEQLDIVTYMGVHAGLCALTAGAGGCWIWRSVDSADAKDQIMTVLQAAGWTMLAGPFGTVIAAALLVPQSAAARNGADTAGADTAGARHELSRLELLHGALLDKRLRLGDASTIRPLLDVIIDGTQSEKLDALSLVHKRYTPALAPALKRALEDGDASVRVLAATVMAQQHNTFTRQIGSLQTAANDSPEHPESWNELAQAHLRYAGSGLLEASRAEAELRQAREHLARAAQLMGRESAAPEPADEAVGETPHAA